MNYYEKLPVEFLIRFYNEIKKNIENELLTDKMYYELYLIFCVAKNKGISLDLPSNFHKIVNLQVLNNLLQSEPKGTGNSLHIA
ncbi:hypothetical protein HPT25_14070 [Bacillus sp. BRMEA1]|uniref:hypothetical protein n=1 Tax=Neobacillus endophyticus TaxID=2738405 RepID=UPI001566545F|nr:hypothetical protein [Neobacillus endophyticus]NRD78488.1 hypothetical protein [Neobacillus endophyticus]